MSPVCHGVAGSLSSARISTATCAESSYWRQALRARSNSHINRLEARDTASLHRPCLHAKHSGKIYGGALRHEPQLIATHAQALSDASNVAIGSSFWPWPGGPVCPGFSRCGNRPWS
jgi:hypothetical protein